MKAAWDVNDFEQMARKPLSFNHEDVIPIGRGLKARESRLVMMAVSSVSKTGTL
jgi:hypothetical protein